MVKALVSVEDMNLIPLAVEDGYVIIGDKDFNGDIDRIVVRKGILYGEFIEALEEDTDSDEVLDLVDLLNKTNLST